MNIDRICKYIQQFRTISICLIIIVVAWGASPEVQAQGKVQVVLHAPPPFQMNIESLWRVDLINSSTKRMVRLVGIATETRSRKWIASGVSINFEIPSGFTSVNPNEISPIDYDADPDYNEIVTRTGKVPSGEYTICMYVVDAVTNDTLGKDCINQHLVLNVTPPQLIHPRKSSIVQERLPAFSWTPISPLVPVAEITYSIKVVEILGRQSPIDAIQSNTVWFGEDDIPIPLIQYPLSAEPLEAGISYAWQISAFGTTAGGVRVELCRSEIWSFSILKKDTDTKDDTTISEGESTNPDGTTGKGTDTPGSTTGVDGGSTSKGNPKEKPGTTTRVNESPKAIAGVEPSPMDNVCKALKVEFLKSPPQGSFQVIITNKVEGDTENIRPVGFAMRIKGDSITDIGGKVSDGWLRTPSKFPPGSSDVRWTRESGVIPKGMHNLGTLSFKNSAGSPVKINYKWINQNDKILCADSVVLNEVITYYELSDEWSNTNIEVPNDVLHLQYANNYASTSGGEVIIYDAENQERIVPKGNMNSKPLSINGINRIAIPLQEYGLMKNKNYMLTISDSKNNYNLYFTIKADKVTNDREK